MSVLRKSFLFSLSIFLLGAGMYSYRLLWGGGGRPAPETLDDYWAETGIGFKEFRQVVSPENCRLSPKHFLACVNAANAAAARLQLTLELSGRIVARESHHASSEREFLTPFKDKVEQDPSFLEAIHFDTVLSRLEQLAQTARMTAPVAAAGINGFLSIYRDPHTYIIPINFYRDVVAKSAYNSMAIGFILDRLNDGQFVLRKVIQGSSAERYGLRTGDLLLSVNGRPVKGLTMEQVTERLRAKPGDYTKLTLQRGSVTREVRILREEKPFPTVASRVQMGEKRIGILSVTKFARDTCAMMKKELQGLREASIQGLILDLRDNSGGLMREAACAIGLFTGPGKKAFEVRFLNPALSPEIVTTDNEQVYSGRIAVLINRGSASAAEILAGALREHRGAVLVGERSFGKGSFQEPEVWSLNDKVALFSTKGFYLLPSRSSTQLNGLEPDYEVGVPGLKAESERLTYMFPLVPQEIHRASLPSNRMKKSAFDESGNCFSWEFENLDEQVLRAGQVLMCGAAMTGGILDRN
ncbi:MAG: S41 family peptidase [Bdellovibrionaceae bacterium]|nr:S41 family peptidase [Pseudobdellovibrionaceae bacterium]